MAGKLAEGLAGRLALVTGGGGGIGRAVSQLFARAGASVIVADIKEGDAQGTVNTLEKTPLQHSSFELDVTSSEQISQFMEKVNQNYNRYPCIAVNCHGITRDDFILKMSEERFNEVINVNLKGTFLMIQAVAKGMFESKIENGSIINVGSISGKVRGRMQHLKSAMSDKATLLSDTNTLELDKSITSILLASDRRRWFPPCFGQFGEWVGNLGQVNYVASKAAIEGMTRTCAKELSVHGIRCNVILPGFIQTSMLATVPPKLLNKFTSAIPLRRLGNPNDVANAIYFLASPQSSYITGTSLEVTGGIFM